MDFWRDLFLNAKQKPDLTQFTVIQFRDSSIDLSTLCRDLTWPGLFEATLLNSTLDMDCLIRIPSDPRHNGLVTLLGELFQLDQEATYDNILVGEVIVIPGTSEWSSALTQTLKKHPKAFEDSSGASRWRWLKAGSPWELSSHQRISPKIKVSPAEMTVELTEHRFEGSKTVTMDPILSRYPQSERSLRDVVHENAPLTICIPGVPQKNEIKISPEQLLPEVLNAIALADRHPLQLRYLASPQSTSTKPFALPQFQVSAAQFGTFQDQLEYEMMFVGPWSLENLVLNRRIESFLSRIPDDHVVYTCSPNQKWNDLYRSLQKHRHWVEHENGLRSLELIESKRDACWMGLFVAAPFRQFAGTLCQQLNLNFLSLAKSARGKLAKHQDIPLPSETRALEWSYPIPKSTTHGFDRVHAMPHEFLKRVIDWGYRKQFLEKEFFLIGGDSIERAPKRNRYTAPLSTSPFLNTSSYDSLNASNHHLVKTSVYFDQYLLQDPRENGRFSIEFALRKLFCEGGNPRHAQIRIFYSTHARQKSLSSLVLQLDGIHEAAQAMDSQVISTLPLHHLYQDRLLLEVISDRRNPWQAPGPGFRMDGELIYSIGSKPVFMESGSPVLKYVTVKSTHISKFDPTDIDFITTTLQQFIQKSAVSSIRAIDKRGAIAAIAEMSLWSGLGFQVNPLVGPVELFSGTPGRFIVGVLEHAKESFESSFRSEQFTWLGAVKGNKLFGLTLDEVIATYEV